MCANEDYDYLPELEVDPAFANVKKKYHIVMDETNTKAESSGCVEDNNASVCESYIFDRTFGVIPKEVQELWKLNKTMTDNSFSLQSHVDDKNGKSSTLQSSN
jgi:hypothetical protein